MKILLQQKNTGLYFKDVDHWTPNPTDAMDFMSSTKAMEFCGINRITGVQLVLKFQEQMYDIVLPMIADRRDHGLRPGAAA